jgi:calcineurin-like phosphoesterase family protein
MGHAGIIKFKDKHGQRIRPFESIEEHDQTIIDNHNKVVKPEDRVYFLGDIAINRKAIPLISKFNGRKKLIKGNHDIFKLPDYTEIFEDILAYRIYPKHGLVVSHIPIHPSQLEFRFKYNMHGHSHSNHVCRRNLFYRMVPDRRFINICPEIVGFRPIEFEEIQEWMKNGTAPIRV